MKKIDFDSFAKYLMPHDLAVNEHGVFFALRRVDLANNRYRDELCRLEREKAVKLADVGGAYWALERGIVYIPKGKDKSKPTRFPKTKLMFLDYERGSHELCEIPYAVSSIAFMSEHSFYFTAMVSEACERALAESNGNEKKAEKSLVEQADYQVVDELPFWSNGGDYTVGVRTRLFFWNDGTVIPLSDSKTNIGGLALSPDKKHLVFTQNRLEHKLDLYSRLILLDTATNEAEDISPVDGCDYYAACFAGNERIAVMLSDFLEIGMSQQPALWRYDISAKKAVELNPNIGYGLGSSINCDLRTGGSAWGPFSDGSGVCSIVTDDCCSRLAAFSLETGEVRLIGSATGALSEAVKGADGFYTVAYRGQSGAEIYFISPDGSETRKSCLNTALDKEFALAVPQPLSFVNENGDTIRGFALPAAHDCGRTVLAVHGGPRTAYGSTIIHEMQLLSALGYSVIFCNPTGSDGRGDRFADLRGVYGETDFRDIMSFCDEAAKKFDFVHADNMAIIGGSYGGFMTNYAIGNTDRFKAAVSQRSISNWTMFWALSDIGFYFAEDQTGANPWSNLDLMWKQSPLRYADRVKTPTLFIHSDRDYRCPLPEGMSMYAALVYHNVPARLCIFKGENHELSRSGKPKHRIRRLREMAEWLDKYLD